MVSTRARGASMCHMDTARPGELQRTIGTGGAVLLGLGSIIGTGVFVSIALATAQAGPWVLVAIAIATLTATCNGLSSAQLAATFPVSGGTYEYATRLVSPLAGFSAGWLFLCAKISSAAAAALGASAYLLSLTGYDQSSLERPVAIVLLGLVTGIVLLGLRKSVLTTLVILAVTMAGLLVFLLSSLDPGPGEPGHLVTPGAAGIPGAAAIMFVAFTGYGRIATLGEEIRDPARSIPRAIIITLACAGAIYLVIGWALSFSITPGDLVDESPALNPLESIAERAWGTTAGMVVAIAAIAAMAGVLLNLLLGLSRVVLAMARRGDMPKPCRSIGPRTSTPWMAVLGIAIIIGLIVLLGDFTFAWSLSAFTVLIYYGLTNLAALRLPAEHRSRSRWIASLGLILCGALAFSVPISTWSIGLAVLVVGFFLRWVLHRIEQDRQYQRD